VFSPNVRYSIVIVTKSNDKFSTTSEDIEMGITAEEGISVTYTTGLKSSKAQTTNISPKATKASKGAAEEISATTDMETSEDVEIGITAEGGVSVTHTTGLKSSYMTPKQTRTPKLTNVSKDRTSSKVPKSNTSSKSRVLKDKKAAKGSKETKKEKKEEDNTTVTSDEGKGEKSESKERERGLLEISHGKAKDVADSGFHFVLSQTLLFFQLRSCELSAEAMAKYLDDKSNFSIADVYDCNVKEELENLDWDFLIAAGIAVYGILAAIIVNIHAWRLKDYGTSPIQGMYDCTDNIPILDGLIEIPISLIMAPIVTIILWSLFLGCCVGLVYLSVSYHAGHVENGGNMSTFMLTAFLVAFDIYKMTGDMSQYYVVNKSARIEAYEKKEMTIRLKRRRSRSRSRS